MNEFDSIRITEKGDTLSFEMTNELADSSHEAIFFLIRATSALIASVTKDDADPKEVAEAFGKTFSRHIAQDIQDERDRRAAETMPSTQAARTGGTARKKTAGRRKTSGRK